MQDLKKGAVETFYGPLEAAGRMAYGAMATPVAGLAGLAQGAYNVGREALGYQPGMPAGNVVENIMNAPGPARTQVAQTVERGMGTVFNPAIQAARAPGRMIAEAGAPATGAIVSAIPEAAASLMAPEARGAMRAVGETAGRVLPRPPVAQVVQQARQAGYVIKPSEAGATVGKVAEGLTGSPRLSIEATIKNQKVTNDLAATELGLPKGTSITPKVIIDLKKPHNAVYKEVGELGNVVTDDTFKNEMTGIGRAPGTSFQKVRNPDIERLREQYTETEFNAKDAVLQIRILRRNGSKNLKSPDPAKNEVGYAERQVADAIEAQLERHATAVGNPDLVTRFRQARRELAKINNVSDAMIAATGDVSASKLAKAKGKGAPLTGNLATIADTHDAFPSEMRDVSKLRNKVPITVLEGVAGLAGGVGAKFAASPALGAASLAAVTARPLTRKYLLSEAYQNRLAGRTPQTLGTLGKVKKKSKETLGRVAPYTAGQQDQQQ